MLQIGCGRHAWRHSIGLPVCAPSAAPGGSGAAIIALLGGHRARGCMHRDTQHGAARWGITCRPHAEGWRHSAPAATTCPCPGPELQRSLCLTCRDETRFCLALHVDWSADKDSTVPRRMHLTPDNTWRLQTLLFVAHIAHSSHPPEEVGRATSGFDQTSAPTCDKDCHAGACSLLGGRDGLSTAPLTGCGPVKCRGLRSCWTQLQLPCSTRLSQGPFHPITCCWSWLDVRNGSRSASGAPPRDIRSLRCQAITAKSARPAADAPAGSAQARLKRYSKAGSFQQG